MVPKPRPNGERRSLTMKEDKRWVWICGHDTWSWDDGVRCYACSRKPTTKKAAEKSLRQHLSKTGHTEGTVRRLTRNKRW